VVGQNGVEKRHQKSGQKEQHQSRRHDAPPGSGQEITGEGRFDPRYLLVGTALMKSVSDTVIHVILKHHPRHFVQSRPSRGHLVQDRRTIAILLQHPPDTADLAFQSGHALQKSAAIVGGYSYTP
jgi:hypothetical protein